jgi:hypothetical protein
VNVAIECAIDGLTNEHFEKGGLAGSRVPGNTDIPVSRGRFSTAAISHPAVHTEILEALSRRRI